jgi:ACS family allantoate permease-like MFS transporter
MLTLFTAMLPLVLLMHCYTSYLNRKKDVELAKLKQANGWTAEDVEREAAKAAFLDLTDRKNVFARYMS